MGTNVSTNCKIFIGSAAADSVDTITEFEADSYTELVQVLDIGDFGDEANAISVKYLDSGREENYKGTRNAGVLPLELGYDPEDAGHAALIAAEEQPDNYAFKVELNDGASTPTTWFFRGQVMSAKVGGFTADEVIKLMASVAVNSKPLKKAST